MHDFVQIIVYHFLPPHRHSGIAPSQIRETFTECDKTILELVRLAVVAREAADEDEVARIHEQLQNTEAKDVVDMIRYLPGKNTRLLNPHITRLYRALED